MSKLTAWKLFFTNDKLFFLKKGEKDEEKKHYAAQTQMIKLWFSNMTNGHMKLVEKDGANHRDENTSDKKNMFAFGYEDTDRISRYTG